MAFNNRLREARLAKKMTQSQLGTAIGVATSTVAGYEKGSSEPDIPKIVKIMETLSIDANFLWQDEMKISETKKSPELTEVNSPALDDDTQQLVEQYRSLTDEDQYFVKRIIHSLTSKEK